MIICQKKNSTSSKLVRNIGVDIALEFDAFRIGLEKCIGTEREHLLGWRILRIKLCVIFLVLKINASFLFSLAHSLGSQI